jgi:hypothetical protein
LLRIELDKLAQALGVPVDQVAPRCDEFNRSLDPEDQVSSRTIESWRKKGIAFRNKATRTWLRKFLRSQSEVHQLDKSDWEGVLQRLLDERPEDETDAYTASALTLKRIEQENRFLSKRREELSGSYFLFHLSEKHPGVLSKSFLHLEKTGSKAYLVTPDFEVFVGFSFFNANSCMISLVSEDLELAARIVMLSLRIPTSKREPLSMGVMTRQDRDSGEIFAVRAMAQPVESDHAQLPDARLRAVLANNIITNEIASQIGVKSVGFDEFAVSFPEVDLREKVSSRSQV